MNARTDKPDLYEVMEAAREMKDVLKSMRVNIKETHSRCAAEADIFDYNHLYPYILAALARWESVENLA